MIWLVQWLWVWGVITYLAGATKSPHSVSALDLILALLWPVTVPILFLHAVVTTIRERQ